MHNKLSQVDKKFLRTSCAEKRWVDDGSGLAQILEDELHLTAREVPVVDTVARSQQGRHQAVGVVDVAVEPTQCVYPSFRIFIFQILTLQKHNICCTAFIYVYCLSVIRFYGNFAHCLTLNFNEYEKTIENIFRAFYGFSVWGMCRRTYNGGVYHLED